MLCTCVGGGKCETLPGAHAPPRPLPLPILPPNQHDTRGTWARTVVAGDIAGHHRHEQAGDEEGGGEERQRLVVEGAV